MTTLKRSAYGRYLATGMYADGCSPTCVEDDMPALLADLGPRDRLTFDRSWARLVARGRTRPRLRALRSSYYSRSRRRTRRRSR